MYMKTRTYNAQPQYANFKKPSWAPPSWLFGPAWTVLYILIAISYGSVFWSAYTSSIAAAIISPFVLNLVFNAIYTPIQFGLRNNYLACVDIVLVLATIIWSIVVIYPLMPWVAYMQIPYLAWVSFATVLQFTVTYLNRKQT